MLGEIILARITSKGRLTLPREIRKARGVGPGDHVAFEVTDRGETVQPVRPANVFRESAGRSRRGDGMSVDEINGWLRDRRGHDEWDHP